MRSTSLLLAIASAIAQAGCFLLVNLGDYKDEPAAAGSSSSAGGSGQGGAAQGGAAQGGAATSGGGGSGGSVPPMTCPTTTYGPPLVLIQTSSGGYCIDSTEVTNDQYYQWTMSLPSSPTFTDVCVWKGALNLGGAPDDKPVVNVDWCDAREFCRAAGKRLCGKIGGGPVPFLGGGEDPNVSEWYRACSQGGTTVYPYGDTYDAMRCDGGDTMSTDVAGEMAYPSCHGTTPPFAELFNMSGNAYEWEDSCSDTTGAMDVCYRRGGSYQSSSPQLTCGHVDTGFTRTSIGYTTGIRCCADAQPLP